LNSNRVVTDFEASGQHTSVESIIRVLVKDEYKNSNGDSIIFEVFRTIEKPFYQKINTGNLGSDAFIIVKGFALKDEEATIEIFEKSPFLLMEDEIPLTVIQYDTLEAEEPNEGENKTELKAIFNDKVEAVVKIKFRPKVEDPDAVYKEWQEKFVPKEPISLPPPSVEEMKQITPSAPLTFGSDVPQNGTEISIDPADYPLPSNQKPELPPIVDFLWLKVKVSGDKQDYDEEFLKIGSETFILKSNNCDAKFQKIAPIIFQHEGGFVNDPADSGGATNHGIAWNTWVSFAQSDLGIEPTLENLQKLTSEQAAVIYRKRYWEPKGFCRVVNDKVGLMIYDWTITSGGAAREVQRLLVNEFNSDISVDGNIGTDTINAINDVSDQNLLLNRVADIRKQYYTNLTYNRDGTRNKNIRFLNGWINRVNNCLNIEV